MKTKEKDISMQVKQVKKSFTFISVALLFLIFLVVAPFSASSHCDSYDGPTIKDAIKALETNNPDLLLKWINKDQEEEVLSLFATTYSLRDKDKQIYTIVEKHFLETFVRLHRETENAPFTGLKPAGSTKKIVQLSDQALKNDDIEYLIGMLNNHIGNVVREKFNKTASLKKEKDTTPEKGREYVNAYVDYTHTLEAIHDILDHGAGHNH